MALLRVIPFHCRAISEIHMRRKVLDKTQKGWVCMLCKMK